MKPTRQGNEVDALEGDVAALRESLLEACRHHANAAKHQQVIRDRWAHFYFMASILIFGVAGACLAVGDRLPQDVRVVSWMTLFVGIFGLPFLILYMFQATNYHLHYLSIARIHECLLRLHGVTLTRLQFPNPFTYAYCQYRSLSLNNEERGATRAARILDIMCDVHLWGADFWGNTVHILFISASVGAAAPGLGMPPGSSVAVAILASVLLVVFRQIGMALLLVALARSNARNSRAAATVKGKPS